nr:retrovirus-related Pol polyprotein from transposon TNT 1-94 [Tanacetum cinerariifolium]
MSYEGVFLGYSQSSKAYVVLNKYTVKVEESLNVAFDESPRPTKLSPLVDDDVGEEDAIRKNTKIVNTNNEEDESIEVEEIVNIKESKNHLLYQVIGNLNQRTLRSQAQNHSNFFCFISIIEPKNVNEALKDESWVVAMQEELFQFIANDIWELVPLPLSQSIIETKWVIRKKLDENGIVSRNKARLVAQGYNQQEAIDYNETYAPVARLESIRILLAIACANDFKLYQMDVKSAFLNGFINEEVYVAQPLGFIDFQKPNYVYKHKKALHGLKQALKDWYDRLKAFLIKHEYSIGMVDNILFTKKSKSHLIIVQIYVDDIILGSTSQNLCDDFGKIMHGEFEMSMMGELNFFLGLQIKQIEDEIFFNKSKYIKEMLKKFGLEDSKPTKTPMSTEIKLTKDDEADFIDSSKYRAPPMDPPKALDVSRRWGIRGSHVLFPWDKFEFQKAEYSMLVLSLVVEDYQRELQLESLKKLQLQFFGYLEDQDHLHFSVCSGSETEKDLSKSFSLTCFDNLKPNDVYLLLRRLKQNVSLLEEVSSDDNEMVKVKVLMALANDKNVVVGKESARNGKKNGRMMLESIENGPLVYPTIEENGVIRPKKYAQLTKQEKLQDDCDVQEINIILQVEEGVPVGSAGPGEYKVSKRSSTRMEQTDDLDAYDSDCDDISSVKAVLMANLLSYGSNILSEIELSLDNDRLLDHIICQDVMNIVMHDNFVPANVLSANHKCLVDGNLESERLKQENNHLFELLLSQDIVHICVNSLATLTNYAKIEQDYIDEYNENLVLKAELAKKEQMVEKKFFDELYSDVHDLKSVMLSKIVLWYLDFGCSKHMTGNRSQLINFVHKFLGTVRFGNDQIAKLIGYGDYQMGNVMIYWVYYVEGLGHNLFSGGQFCDSNLEVAFSKHICYIRDLEDVDLLRDQGAQIYTPIFRRYDAILSYLSLVKSLKDHALVMALKFVNQTPEAYYEDVGISHQTPVAISLQQNSIVERQNQTLVEATRTILIFSKTHLFLWAEAVATACYIQNRSLICKRHNKTLYELLHNKKPDLSHLYVFGALCYPTNNFKDIGPGPQLLTPGTISSGLVPNPSSPTPYVPPIKKDRDTLFQPMFDEYFNPPPPSVVSLVFATAAPRPADPTGTPSSTIIDQDAPSLSTSQTPQETQSPVIPSGVKEHIHDIEVAHLDNKPFFGVPIPKLNSKEYSSRDGIPTNVHSVNQPPDHLRK